MAESSDLGTSIPWSAIFAACTVLGGVFYWLIPVVSLRPATPPSDIMSAIGFQDIDARLWQDPLAAAYEREKKEREKPPTTSPSGTSANVHELSGIWWPLTRTSRKRVVILPVMIPGRPFFEDAETRIRTRVAVTSALGFESYVPDDAEHLGSLYFDWPKTQMQVAVKSPTSRPTGLADSLLIVPYEWWHRQEKDADCILVLWLNEDLFADLPLTRLRRFFAALFGDPWIVPDPSQAGWARYDPPTQTFSPGTENGSGAFKFLISMIGPARSTTLDAMIDEIGWLNDNQSPDRAREAAKYPLHNLRVYSGKATAEDDLLTSDLPGATSMATTPKASVGAILNDALVGMRFERTTTTDRDLCKLLVCELAQRGVGPKDRIALVSEWDTYYGRALPASFAAAANPKSNSARDYVYSGKAPQPAWPPRISHFSYLRGIDGKLPGDAAESQQKPKPAPTHEPSRNFLNPSPDSDSHTAEGRDQSDYVIRLAEELEEINRHPTDGRESGEFKAIGVLGSDVYDKLQILQALRPRFPHVIFFTTDLDARLCSDSVWKTTHNLVIASPFGLELKPHYGSYNPTCLQVPPFRDCHQTAVYYSTLLALEDASIGKSDYRAAPPAQLFEVGRRGPLLLTRPPSCPADTAPTTMPSETLALKSPDGVQPLPSSAIDGFKITLIGSGVLLVAACLAVLIACRNNEIFFRPSTRHSPAQADLDLWLAISVAVGMVFAWGVLLVCIGAQTPGGVPFALFDGLSLWPTEFLRILASALGVFFLVSSYLQLKRTIDPASPDRLQCPDRQAKGQEIWNRYCKEAALPMSQRRLWLLLGIAIIFALGALMIFGKPQVPFRGTVSRDIDILVHLGCLIVFTALSCFAANAAQRCGVLIEEYTESARNCAPPGVNDLTHLQFLGTVTKPVERMVYYPFVVLAILIVSYGSYFADWGFPLTVGFYTACIASMALIGAWRLRRAASQAKSSVIERLRTRVLTLPSNDPQRGSLQSIVEEIKEYVEGAFGTVSQHPVVAALLLPSSGLGVWALLQYLGSS